MPQSETLSIEPPTDLSRQKFSDPMKTVEGKTRAWVTLKQLETLWINTGTLCNLTCENCYIESSPSNDRLVYITAREVARYLEEIERDQLGTREIGFTGGEPFMNPDLIEMLEDCLVRGFQVLCLTNAMRPMEKRSDALKTLGEKYGDQLELRVSLDHYEQKIHARERGPRAWKPAMKGLQWLSDEGFNISVAARTCWGESEDSMRKGFYRLFDDNDIRVDARDPHALVLFPEMDETVDVPEITTDCWSILGVDPEEIMCATSRMVVKRKGAQTPVVVACTLLPYDKEFEYAETLADSRKSIRLNHPHCAKFCVLGGGSCSQD